MKHLFILLLLPFATSCNRSLEPDPEPVAHTFLSVYFQLDYDQIRTLCLSGSVLQSDMERNAQTFSGYPAEIRDQLRNDLTAYSFSIEKVYVNRAKDSAFVTYTIFTPEIPSGVESRLTLTKEEKEWKVAKLL